MILGIMSDSHGDRRRVEQALEVLRLRRVETIVHCGDLGHGCIESLGQAGVPVYAVAGNIDFDPVELAQQAAEAGVRFDPIQWIVPIEDGRTIAVAHGHDARVLHALIRSGQHAYVLHGHTHQPRDERIGPTRVINSGALHRASQPSLAVLDTQRDALEFVPVK